MTDEVQKLRETITSLHAELDTVEARDPEVRRLLASALQDIADKLSARQTGAAPLVSPEPGPEASATTGQLAESARQFEVDHPTMAATLRGVVEALTRMGI